MVVTGSVFELPQCGHGGSDTGRRMSHDGVDLGVTISLSLLHVGSPDGTESLYRPSVFFDSLYGAFFSSTSTR